MNAANSLPSVIAVAHAVHRHPSKQAVCGVLSDIPKCTPADPQFDNDKIFTFVITTSRALVVRAWDVSRRIKIRNDNLRFNEGVTEENDKGQSMRVVAAAAAAAAATAVSFFVS